MHRSEILSCEMRGSILLEIIITMTLLGLMMTASVMNFSFKGSLLPLRLDSFKIQALLRQTVGIAHASGETVKIFVQSSNVIAETGSSVRLSPGVSIRNPTQLSIYPTRVLSPYTLVLANHAGECRLTFSLRARIKVGCFFT